MTEWKCGRCGKEYLTEEYLKLRKVKMVEDDPDPMKNYGYTKVCDCGYTFHKDKWHLVDNVRWHDCTFRVSTVFLEMEHWGGMWYETMVFKDEGELNVRCDYQERYKTQTEAEEGHKRALKAIQEGKCTLEPSEWKLTLIVDCGIVEG